MAKEIFTQFIDREISLDLYDCHAQTTAQPFTPPSVSPEIR